jgi:hypothetical protein
VAEHDEFEVGRGAGDVGEVELESTRKLGKSGGRGGGGGGKPISCGLGARARAGERRIRRDVGRGEVVASGLEVGEGHEGERGGRERDAR